MSELTRREDELLRFIQQWYAQKGANSVIPRKWIEQKMSISTTRISDIKKGLVVKGFLNKDRENFVFTTHAITYLNKASMINSRITMSAYLPMLGQVRAGKTKQDELRIDMEDFSYDDAIMITIPNIEENTEAFILEVVGFSMEHERIYEGDYVIIQPYKSNQMPRQRELIVTLYLPPRNEREVEETVDMDETWFDGPTLKYFTEIPGKDRPYRLSWKRDIHNSEYTIDTKRIKPLGRVIGIYRPIIK